MDRARNASVTRPGIADDGHTIREKDAQHVLHPWDDLSALGRNAPFIVERAKGVHVFDVDGRRYLDAIGGMWCVTVGYGREELADAISAQARRMAYYTPFADMGSVPGAELAGVLADLAPGDLRRVHFTTCGSTAVDSAVRTAHYYFKSRGRGEKRHVLSRTNAYHGSTYLAASLSGKAADRTHFQYEAGFIRHLSSAGHDPDTSREAPEQCCARLIAELEEAILDIGPERVACFIAEPIAASGGVLVPPPGYHARALEVCRRYDVLYICDEVVTGFGRLGHFFASRDHFGIVPDMIVTAKGLTSGYQPLGAVLISERIVQAMVDAVGDGNPTFTNGFTYSGHPVACACALANIEIMRREDICGHVRDVGPYFIDRLRTLRGHEIVWAVRGDHLMACIECRRSKDTEEVTAFDVALARRVDRYCQQAGLLVRPYENLSILSPPLTVSREEIDEIVTILDGALRDAANDARRGSIE